MFSLSEEYADLLTRMALSYEADAEHQGKKHMGGAFLNGYQTALYHLQEYMKQKPDFVRGMLPQYLDDMMAAFDELARRGGVQPSIKIEDAGK